MTAVSDRLESKIRLLGEGPRRPGRTSGSRVLLNTATETVRGVELRCDLVDGGRVQGNCRDVQRIPGCCRHGQLRRPLRHLANAVLRVPHSSSSSDKRVATRASVPRDLLGVVLYQVVQLIH